ncbi:MoaD/ThiS family protein [Candidatus Pacearchaeota archaeon]|nr:MoaD/ThiS family protein [Candidatus Pacearchaeota archaeon]
MKAYYDRVGKELSFKAKNVSEMLKELKIMKNTVIVVANNEIVNEDYKFKEKDKVKILSVVSGG